MAEGALFLGEQVLVRRVVLIHEELVREVEADAAEGIGFAGRLRDADAAVGGARELEAHAVEHGRVLRQGGQIFVVDDRRRHVPGRIDGDELHRLRQFRRRMLAGLADDDARGPCLRAVVHQLQGVVGDVEDHIGVAERFRTEFARQPAPALHVGAHDIDLAVVPGAVHGAHGGVIEHAGRFQIVVRLELAHRVSDRRIVALVVGVFRDVELRAQGRHALVFHHHRVRILFRRLDELQRVAFGDVLGGVFREAAQFGELRLQALVALVRRIVALECRRSVLRRGDVDKHLDRIDRMFGIGDIRADAREVHAAALGVACVVEHAFGQAQFGLGLCVRRGSRGEIRRRIIGGAQTFAARVLETCDHALGARRGCAGFI